MVCKKIGVPDPDTAGIGILVGFSAQALISLLLSIWVFYLSKIGRLNVAHPHGSKEHEIETGRLRIVEKVLMVGNDYQMATGIALIITALSAAMEIDLYHLRLIYEVVSFVGVSGAATMTCWTFTSARVSEYRSRRHKDTPRISRLSPRHLGLYMYVVLFFALSVLLGVRLNEWDDEEEGHCYNSHLVTASQDDHPGADKTYLGFTAAWMLLSLIMSVLGDAKRVKKVLGLAALQYPLHLYMMIVLRLANTDLLEGDGHESDWRFGQTVAVLLFGLTFRELLIGLWKYARYERTVTQKRSRQMHDMEAKHAERVEKHNEIEG